MVEEISEHIKSIRQKLGLTQRAFAKKVGATHISVFKWEKGKSKPHPMFVEKIEALNEANDSSNPSV